MHSVLVSAPSRAGDLRYETSDTDKLSREFSREFSNSSGNFPRELSEPMRHDDYPLDVHESALKVCNTVPAAASSFKEEESKLGIPETSAGATTPLCLQGAHDHSDQTNAADAEEHSGFHLLRAGAANVAGVAGVGEASEALALSLLSVQQRSSAAGQIFLALLSPSQKTFALSGSPHESNEEPTGNSAGGVSISNVLRPATFVPKLNLQHLCDSQKNSLSKMTALHPIEEGHDLGKEEWEEEQEEEEQEEEQKEEALQGHHWLGFG